MSAKWQAPLIEMMSRSGSAETGVDPDAATERQTVETTSRMVKAGDSGAEGDEGLGASHAGHGEGASGGAQLASARNEQAGGGERVVDGCGGKVDGDDKGGRGGDEGELDELDEGPAVWNARVAPAARRGLEHHGRGCRRSVVVGCRPWLTALHVPGTDPSAGHHVRTREWHRR